MALLDDDDAFEAALAFLEEYEFEETKTEELDSLSGQDEAVQTLQEGSDSFYSHLVVEQQQKVADNLRSLLRKRATHLAKEYSAFTDAANSGHYIDRALDFRGNIGMEKHIMGNGGLYQKTAKDLDQPYTIIEDFTKELRDENLT
ncbi:hypothetical protein PC122_g5500 [Phytophthora cactorum]|nr:hypothetical protein PC122_g5500 [Phytophthora cactorum]